MTRNNSNLAGILLINKPEGKTAFSLVRCLRKHLGVKKIGHAGTLDPFATGVMVMLIGREFTKLSDTFLKEDKEYTAEIHLGTTTDSYDCDGNIIDTNNTVCPTINDIEEKMKLFQGEIEQIPPMFSAKKVNGKKLYQYARKGETIVRASCKVNVSAKILKYEYPYLTIEVQCSKGTYIRSLAHDLGKELGCGAHLTQLQRTRSGKFHLKECFDGTKLFAHQLNKNSLIEAIKLL